MRKFSIVLVFSAFNLFAPQLGLAAEQVDGVVWIDVRPASDYRQGHIEGAINIPHGEIGHRIQTLVPDLSTEVHLYGENNVFAGLALEMLMEMGFEYVVNEGAYQSIVDKQQD